MKGIKNKTNILLGTVQDAIKWSELSDDEIVRNGLKKPFKSFRRDLSVIKEALNKRPSIAIFGQSQVGKSYLVQNLAKPFDSQYLKIKVSEDKGDINFLTEMNPDGGQESTGFVTRFTTKNIPEDNLFPFEAELFSQLDIAAILVNAFCSDLKDYDESIFELDHLEIKDLFENLKTETKQEGVTEDETYFFIKYIEDHFKDFALVRELKRIGYFKNLETKLHYIEPDSRSKVLRFLWGQNTFFTHLFNLLSDQIKTLKFNKNIRLDLNALTPQSKTILDVERVREVLDKEKEDFIEVKLSNGQIEKSSRSLIGVLTREVQLQLTSTFEEDNPQSFLNTSDLLDFPGSKSREKIPLDVFNNNTEEQKLQLLIRGKVSFLFDSYTNKLGVSTLLYCLDDSPPEEKDAPNRLFNWVKKYVGSNEENRSKTLSKTKKILSEVDQNVTSVSPLLVVFTKFNQELNKVLPGKESSIESHDSKWTARFGENFLNFMSRPVEDKWLANWTKEESNFKFIFPIRDPLYSQATFEGFELKGAETAIRAERQEAMRAMKTSFTEADVVNQHTLSPLKIWDEISTPNGTGIVFLSKHLKNSSHPIVTKTRLEIDLNRIQNEMLEILKPFQVSGNLEEDLKKARLNGAHAFTSLVAMANKKNSSLHKILSSLVISDTEIWNLLYDYIFGMNREENTEDDSNIDIVKSFEDIGVSLKPGMTKDEILELLRYIYDGLNDEEIEEVIIDTFSMSLDKIPSLISIDTLTNSQEGIAKVIIAFWTENIMNVALNPEVFQTVSEKQEEHFRGLLTEIIKGRARFNLKNIITDTIKDVKSGTIAAEDIDLVASCCTTILNKFLFSAGWAFAEEKDKPEINEQVPIFSEVGKVYQEEDLNYSVSKNKDFFRMWSLGCRSLYVENVMYQYNLEDAHFNSMANQKLNGIITELSSNR